MVLRLMYFLPGFVLLILLCIGSTAAAETAGEREANAGMDQARAHRWASAGQTTLVAALYDLRTERETRLVLTNRFGEPLDVNIDAVARDGSSYPVDHVSLLPREVKVLRLADVLAVAPDVFLQASLRVGFWGDQEMVQAWMIHDGKRGTVASPLTLVGGGGVTAHATWDLRPWPRSEQMEVFFGLHNSGDHAVQVDVTWHGIRGHSASETVTLAPGAGRPMTVPGARGRFRAGWVDLDHDGTPGQLAISGFLGGRSSLGLIPVRTRPEVLAESSWSVPQVSFEESTGSRLLVMLQNLFTLETSNRVRISVMEAHSGRELRRTVLQLGPEELHTLELDLSSYATPVRLQVEADRGGVTPAAYIVTPAGDLIDVGLVPRSKVHDSGTYPVPDLDRYEVQTVFLNLGQQSAEVLLQLSWEKGGAWVHPPVEIPPGQTRRIRFNDLTGPEAADRLGRVLDPSLNNGFSQWLARTGSQELLARTEVRRLDSLDRVGFDCFGCCEEWPWGVLVPSSVDFNIGQAPAFETLEYINTCAGTVGPYRVNNPSLTFSAPISWNGQTVSAIDYTNQTVAFSDSGDYMWIDCTTRRRTFGREGGVVVDKCLQEHNPGFDPSIAAGGCPLQSDNCTECFSCCERNKEVTKCRCKKLGQDCGALTAVTQCRTCKTECVNRHSLEACSDVGVLTCEP